ncbi:MAG: pyruvate, phosphate dikinase, partial [Proteobacteria bacterium]|nr:pyruvate, phosphate dikinase [Pseudomonadota bacterium]
MKPCLNTGIESLDRILRGLLPGDNLVWQTDAMADFAPFAAPYAEAAQQLGRRLVYFRFDSASPPLLQESEGILICQLELEQGFEKIVIQIRRAVREAGRGAYFLFDCLSVLADTWCSDRMLGNFFMLICPYVYDMESLAYFPLLRRQHSNDAIAPIARTTQIFIDIHRHRGDLYLHPSKVEHRYSPTMYMLHRVDGDLITPVNESSTTAEILTSMPWAGLNSVRYRLGKWNRLFHQAEQLWNDLQPGKKPSRKHDALRRTLMHMAITRDDRLLELAEKYFSLGDILAIWQRMIGTGLIGGKSVGMLLSRAILEKTHPRWNNLLEAHDSFYIGSDVFYSFLVENGCWWLRLKQHDRQAYLDDIDEARRRMITGNFPDSILNEFAEMLDYFGQSPIIVRSSSLLEDSYGNAFAGKYESVFCANQGSQRKRLEDFVAAVKTIYASTMSEKALRYRAQRGLLDRDEQMPLLVQRVSGSHYGHLFYPQLAGVGLSINPYVWEKSIDPAAGMVRLVFGLGTRAVDRSDDDYTRVVALNEPERRPVADLGEMLHYSQRQVDVLELDANQLVSNDFQAVVEQSPNLPIEVFATEDAALLRRFGEERRARASSWVLTFDQLLGNTDFVEDMREMLATLQKAYQYPVDVEFTANFSDDEHYQINLVQCRPLQVVQVRSPAELPANFASKEILLESVGAVIGQSRLIEIDRIVYVSPAKYSKLSL